MNPADPVLSALSLPLAHDEDRYRSYPQTKALCAPLQGLKVAEAGYTVMRAIEGRIGDQLIPNKDGDLYTKEKKEARWAFLFFSFDFIELLPSSISVLSFSKHSLGLNHTMHHSLDGLIWNLGLLWEYISAQSVWKVNLVYYQYEVRGAAAVVINDSRNFFEKVVWAFSDLRGFNSSGWKERSPTSLSAMVGGFCEAKAEVVFMPRTPKNKFFVYMAFEVMITLGEASSLTVTKAHLHQFLAMTAVDCGYACPEHRSSWRWKRVCFLLSNRWMRSFIKNSYISIPYYWWVHAC